MVSAGLCLSPMVYRYALTKIQDGIRTVDGLDFPLAAEWYLSIRSKVDRSAMWQLNEQQLPIKPKSQAKLLLMGVGLNLRLHPPAPLPGGTHIKCFELLTETSPGKLDPVWNKITDERSAALVCVCTGEYQGLADAAFEL
jgi:hypothetical protein